ncbi:COG4223 family protein [Phyllobacterium bourgognense]|nr:mitofilin family membrane protein [Phyllobacterium bourgognense]
MAKSSVPRHSKSARKPVTIELAPLAVDKAASKADVPQPEPVGFDPATDAKANVAEKSKEKPRADGPPSSGFTEAGQSFGRTESSPQSKLSRSTSSSGSQQNDQLGRIVSGVIGGVVALAGAAALQWAGVLPSPKADTSALEQQIAELRNARPAAQTLDEGGQVALNGAVENAKQAASQVSGLSAELVAIKQSIADIQKNAGSGAAVDTSGIDARLAALETRLSNSQQQAEQAGGAAAGATERLNALEAKVNDPSAQANMALAMAATGMKAAIDRGEPFAAELDTYVAVAPQAGEVESLRGFAAKGIPPLNMLVSQFADVAPKIIASAHTVDPNAGVVDRLWASASSLVQARPVGMVEGEGVDAITARIEAHLNAGDLGAAIAEWEKLPENAKAVSMDFANAMKARQKAGDVVSKALSDALTGIKSPAAAN